VETKPNLEVFQQKVAKEAKFGTQRKERAMAKHRNEFSLVLVFLPALERRD
jgi:hypothetical protein